MLSLTGLKKRKLCVVFLKHVFSESERKVPSTSLHGQKTDEEKKELKTMLILRNGFAWISCMNMSLTMYIRRCSDVILDTTALRSSNSTELLQILSISVKKHLEEWEAWSLWCSWWSSALCRWLQAVSALFYFHFWMKTTFIVYISFIPVSFVAFCWFKMLWHDQIENICLISPHFSCHCNWFSTI